MEKRKVEEEKNKCSCENQCPCQQSLMKTTDKENDKKNNNEKDIEKTLLNESNMDLMK